jgi:hypothetical protein
LLVAAADLPEDRTQSGLWTADFSAPDGHGIGAWAWFVEQRAAQYATLLAANQPPAEAPQAVAVAYAGFAAAIQTALDAIGALPAVDPTETDQQAFAATIPAQVAAAVQNLATALATVAPEPEHAS